MQTDLPPTLHFLVVDDMENMRRSIRAMLKLIQSGWRVTEARDGAEAWKILESGEEEIDFVISDWNMPRLTGTELLNRVRASARTRHIPFLMITAEANREIVAEAAESEVDAYLTKPFVTASLEKKIAELFHRAQNPDPLTLVLNRLKELEEAGEIDQAIELARKATAINKRSSRPYRELGRLCLKKNDIETARKSFLQAISLNQLDVTSFHYLGQIAYQQGNIDAAIDYFARAMDINPRHADRALRFATLLLKKKQPRKAERILRIVLKNNPADTDFREEVAQRCLDGGLYDLAIRIYRELLRIDPARTYLHKLIGMALRRRGNARDALVHLEEAVQLTPDDIDLLLELAQCYCDLRKPVPAEKWAVRVIRLEPENARAREILDRLD